MKKKKDETVITDELPKMLTINTTLEFPSGKMVYRTGSHRIIGDKVTLFVKIPEYKSDQIDYLNAKIAELESKKTIVEYETKQKILEQVKETIIKRFDNCGYIKEIKTEEFINNLVKEIIEGE